MERPQNKPKKRFHDVIKGKLKTLEIDMDICQKLAEYRVSRARLSSAYEQAQVFHEELGLQHKCEHSERWLHRFNSRRVLQFCAVYGEKLDVTKPDAKELSARLNGDDLTERMDVDDYASTAHHYIDSKIVDMVKNTERHAYTGSYEDESSDENEEDVRARVSIDRLITLKPKLLAGLEE
ncbi:Hypothetical predicted protein [Octopus vulgaris]|uniref:HTH CENPB-type domain-containing protein n=1 Tax=Octopus vulgaris TaxID=6645 RepID=A0AA36F5V1_OCTVU|nr:Hypothetical predicted protein [Octopus vulgaris]